MIHFEDEDDEQFYMVRPGLHKFLMEMSKYYELVVFTAALSEYADWILDQVDTKKLIKHRLYRQHCNHQETYAIKDLNNLGRDLSKTIIVDNIGLNFESTTPENGIQIESWYNDMEDKELEKIGLFLTEMAL